MIQYLLHQFERRFLGTFRQPNLMYQTLASASHNQFDCGPNQFQKSLNLFVHNKIVLPLVDSLHFSLSDTLIYLNLK